MLCLLLTDCGMESAPEAGMSQKHWPQALKSWSRHQLSELSLMWKRDIVFCNQRCIHT